MNKRRNFKPEQKAKIIIEVLREEKTLTEIAAEYEVHPNQLSRWKAGVPSQGCFIPTSEKKSPSDEPIQAHLRGFSLCLGNANLEINI